jgi:hypothetical protein
MNTSDPKLCTLLMARLLLSFGTLGTLIGCSPPEPEHRSVSWYADHDHERGAKLTWCADDTTRQATDDCQNAAAAMEGAKSNGRQYHPPMNWGPNNPKPSTPPNP